MSSFRITQANLILWGRVQMPPTIGLISVALVIAMGIELSLDMLRTAELAKALQVTESELRNSEERLMLAAAAANAGLWKLNQQTGKWACPWTLPSTSLKRTR